MEPEHKFRELRRILASLDAQLRRIAEGRPGEVRQAVADVAVWGRSVSFVLQNLRSIVIDFDKWYARYEQEMRSDPLLKFFQKVRNESLKTGKDSVAKIKYELPGGATVAVLDTAEVSTPEITFGTSWSLTCLGLFCTRTKDGQSQVALVRDSPPGTSHCFIDDAGIGWAVVGADGSEKKVYAPIPQWVVRQTVEFRDPPDVHLGRKLSDLSALTLCALYVRYLQQMVDDAAKRLLAKECV